MGGCGTLLHTTDERIAKSEPIPVSYLAGHIVIIKLYHSEPIGRPVRNTVAKIAENHRYYM